MAKTPKFNPDAEDFQSSLVLKIDEINQIRLENPLQAVALAEETWKLVQIKIPALQQIPFLITYSNCLSSSGRFSEAVEMISLALKYKKRSGSKDIELGEILSNAGDKLLNLNRFDEALDLLLKAREILTPLAASSPLIEVLLQLGRCYDGLFKFIEAADCLFQAELLAKTHKHPSYQIRIATSLGNVYVDAQDPVKGARYYKQAASLAKKQKKMVLYAGALCNLGKVYTLTDKFDLAFKTADEAIRIYEEYHQVHQLSTMLQNMGILLNAAQRPEEALMYLKRALKSNVSKEKPTFYLSVYVNIIFAQIQLKHYALANKHLQRILPMAQDIKAQNLLLPLYLQGYQICEAQKKWKQALEYYRLAKEIEEDIWDRDKSIQLKQLEHDFSLVNEKQQSEIFRLKNVELHKRNKLINEQKKQLEKANEELKSANDAKSKLFSIIAHDLRGPLSSMYQGIELVAIDDSPVINDKEFLNDLTKSAYEVFALTDNLLRWSAQQMDKIVVKPQSISLEHIINKVINQHRMITSAKRIKVVTEIEAEQPVFADPGFVHVIFRNLLSNAIKFTPLGGEVKITVRLQDGSYICRVIDKGKGISLEDQQHLFEGNLSVVSLGTDKEKGMGLGLNLVKEFADMMGGTVYVHSNPGEGSVFTLTLPVT